MKETSQETARTEQPIDSSRDAVTYVTQSKFFSPSFNAAIFDGPIRIYFAQYQEAQALKLYFNFQQRYADLRKSGRGLFAERYKDRARNIFVMLYPTGETFDLSFAGVVGDDGGDASIVSEAMGDDFVVGVRGPMEDAMLENLCQEMDSIVRAAQA